MATSTISVINYKGGVGKTLVACEVAVTLAATSKVLFVDTDPSLNGTEFHIPDYVPDGFGATPYLLGYRSLKECIRTGSYCDVLPADPDLVDLAGMKSRETEILARMATDFEKSNYGFVVIDTPGYDVIQIEAALRASQTVIIPVWPEKNGVKDAAAVFNRITGEHPGIQVFILPDKFSRRPFDQKKLAEIRSIAGVSVLPSIPDKLDIQRAFEGGEALPGELQVSFNEIVRIIMGVAA